MGASFITVRKLSWKIIKDYDLKIPINLDYLLKKLDIDIEYTPLPKRVDGIALAVKLARGLIVVNANRPESRRRFTIAHEIGHILRHYPKVEQSGGFFSFLDEKKSVSIYEREANVFATELLMPGQDVIKAFRQHTTSIQELADIFQVSRQAMGIRLEELKLIFPA